MSTYLSTVWSVYKSLHFHPDLVPSDNQPYDIVYGSETHCPSLIQESKRQKTLPFTASIQHVLIVQCEQNGIWKLIYFPNKLKITEYSREKLTTLELQHYLGRIRLTWTFAESFCETVAVWGTCRETILQHGKPICIFFFLLFFFTIFCMIKHIQWTHK